MPTPGLNWLVQQYLTDQAAPATAAKLALLATSRAWYAEQHPTEYPNSANAMLYAYLLAQQPQSYAAQVLGQSPMGYWRLDEPNGATSAADLSAHDNAATVIGAPTLGAAGVAASTAMQKSGAAAQGLRIAPIAAYGAAMAALESAYTVECWVKAPSAPASNAALISWTDDDGNVTPMFLYLSPLGEVNVLIWDGVSPFPIELATTDRSVCDGAWHLITVVLDPVMESLLIMLDGASFFGSSGNTLVPMAPPPNDLGVGSAAGEMGSVACVIDEVAFYPNAQTPEAVLARYQAGVA